MILNSDSSAEEEDRNGNSNRYVEEIVHFEDINNDQTATTTTLPPNLNDFTASNGNTNNNNNNGNGKRGSFQNKLICLKSTTDISTNKRLTPKLAASTWQLRPWRRIASSFRMRREFWMVTRWKPIWRAVCCCYLCSRLVLLFYNCSSFSSWTILMFFSFF